MGRRVRRHWSVTRLRDTIEVVAVNGFTSSKRITAYREPDRACGKTILSDLIDSISSRASAPLIKALGLERTIKRIP